MQRLDQSQWVLVSDRLYQKKDPWEEIPVHLTFPSDRAIVTINLPTAKPNWTRGGGVSQRWSRLLVPVELKYRSLKLSFPKMIPLEPVGESILWFWSYHWISELNIVVEVRRIDE